MTKSDSDLHGAEEAVWQAVKEREPVIRRLALLPRIPEQEMLAAMTSLDLGRSQIYTLIGRYRSNAVASALLPARPGPKGGNSKLSLAVEEVIKRLIDEMYLTRQKPSVSALCRAIAHECRALQLKPPSRLAVETRISRLAPTATVRARNGRKAADDLHRPVAGSYKAAYALEVVQIDHTPVDQIVVDERSRQPLGRPWLTLAVDRRGKGTPVAG